MKQKLSKGFSRILLSAKNSEKFTKPFFQYKLFHVLMTLFGPTTVSIKISVITL